MRQPFYPLLVLPALAACLLLVTACGGDDDGDEPTLRSYFTELEGVFDAFSESSGEVEDRYPEVFEDLDNTQAYYPDLLGEMQTAFAEIAALEPPPEIAPEHQALVAATQDFYDEVGRINSEVQALETDAELAEYVADLNTDPGVTRTRTAVADTCNALQDIADADAVEADLRCGEASDPVENAVLEQYFGAMEDIFERAETGTESAQTALDVALEGATFEAQKEAISAYLTSVESTFTDTINRLRGLGAPEPVRAAQNDFVGAVEDMLASSSSFKANLPNIADAEHLDTRRADFGEEIGAAVEEADAACRELQRIAEGRAIDADLGCES
ncbi:MAG TPA: hypothetical protein VMR52_02765 [Dehalococcoidia bacterium]|nr:hypothetical protein [Dehalococcoidia bacterium]